MSSILISRFRAADLPSAGAILWRFTHHHPAISFYRVTGGIVEGADNLCFVYPSPDTTKSSDARLSKKRKVADSF